VTSMLTPAGLRCAGLRCAHTVNPLGVSPDRVRLSWVLTGTGANRAQRAYQVLVTAESGGPGEGTVAWDSVCWDSGRVESPASADVAYAGAPLAPGGRYRWKVRVWDEAGTGSGWSDPNCWPSWASPTPTAAVSGSAPTGNGGPRPARSSAPTC